MELTPGTRELAGKKLRRLLPQEKSKGIFTEGCPEKDNFLLFLGIHI